MAYRLLQVAALAGAAMAVPAATLPALGADDVGSGRRVQGTVSVMTVPVGDRDGHVMGVVQFSGLTFFANGEIATHNNAATFDLTDGSGSHAGYVVHSFDDGSTSIERYEGEARQGEQDRTVVEGSFTCIGGTGRFADLAGSGTYRGERLGGLQPGDYVYIDFTGSCTAP